VVDYMIEVRTWFLLACVLCFCEVYSGGHCLSRPSERVSPTRD